MVVEPEDLGNQFIRKPMRLLLDIQANRTIVPFVHQHKVVGCIHKWLGPNDWHGQSSLFSFSRLSGGKAVKDLEGILFDHRATFFVGAHNSDFLRQILRGIQRDPEMFDGLIVREVVIEEDPDLSGRDLFYPASPILLKVKQEEHRYKHLLYQDPEANEILMLNLRKKLLAAGIDDADAMAQFVPYEGISKEMLIDYKGIKNKVSWCPIRIVAKPETKLLIWNAGLGNSTGIGFGAIR